MTLLQPSFRGRLRLFFAVIVVIPMIAVVIVLLQLLDATDRAKQDASLSQAQQVATNLFEAKREDAMVAARAVQEDRGLATAIRDEDQMQIRARLERLARRIDAQRIVLELTDVGTFETGSRNAIAGAQAELQDENRRDVGSITVSTTGAEGFALELSELLELNARIDRDDAVLASTAPALEEVSLPAQGRADVSAGDVDYRASRFTAREPNDELTYVSLFAQNESARTGTIIAVVVVVLGFLALAFVFAVIVSRTLSSEVQRLLHAAQRLGRGDFSVVVPAEGNDEFAALGKEFNRMARQLEARLDDLRRERGRLQEAIRRVGESFARGLDRVGVLEIVVQTAVDGVGAASGRATMRKRADAPMEEVAVTGDPIAHHRALHAAEAAVMDAGTVAEITIGGTSALAAPLSATEGGDRVLAIVSVARADRPFTPQERELFAYLTSQAAVSVENVDLHETVQRQAVTDELTGLFNHRRFQEVMDAEVERARRYDQEMGLIMLDIDNFKRVNDTYGHMQGDMVLREVARVLRQSAREIDEPARYGGEEMAVALPQTDLEGAYRFAERVRKRIEALELPLLDGDGVLRVTASFGVASLATAPQSDKEGLVAAADAALYRAKRSGKNRTVKAE